MHTSPQSNPAGHEWLSESASKRGQSRWVKGGVSEDKPVTWGETKETMILLVSHHRLCIHQSLYNLGSYHFSSFPYRLF